MVDLTVTTESVSGGRWILKGFERLMGWASMSFKPTKSRSLVLKRGKEADKFHFSIAETPIPTISEKPIKSLGNFFDSSLRDTAFIKNTCDELDWLGLPRSLSNITLYGNTCNLTLPSKSIEEEFKVLRAREVLQLRESVDPKVTGGMVVVKTSRKWRAEPAVEQVESRLCHGVLVGIVARGRAELGTSAAPQFDKARGKARRQLVQNEVRAAVEEERSSRAVGMRQQDAWTKWEQVAERKITCSWSRLSTMSFQALLTCTAGAWQTHQHACFARRRGPLSTGGRPV